MAEHTSPGLARPTDPLAGTKPRPRAAPPSSHGAAAGCSSISIIRSPTNSTMSNISEGDEDEEDSLSISSASITTTSMLHQEASFCSSTTSSSSSSSNVGGGQTDDSAVHRSNHDSIGDDTSHGVTHGTGAGGSGASDGERNSSGSMATTGSNQKKGVSSVPSPPSSPCGSPKEDDGLGSDRHEDGEGEEEGGGAETAIDKVLELLQQGQEAQQKIAEGMVQQGQSIQLLGRKMAQDAQQAIQEGQQEYVVTAGRVKRMLGHLVYRLNTCEDERRVLRKERDQVRVELGVQRKTARALDKVSTRLDQIQHSLNQEEEKNADLQREFARVTAVKEDLEKANRGLRADVAHLDAAQRQWENNSPAKVAEVHNQLLALQANQEKLATRNVSLCAQKDRLMEVNHGLRADVACLDAAQRQWENNSPVQVAEVHDQLLALQANQQKLVTQNVSLCAEKNRQAETNRGLEAEVARLKEKLATTTMVVDPSLAVSEAATAATGLGGTSMEAPSGASVWPVVSPDPVLSPSPAATAPTTAKDENEHKVKGKAASPSPKQQTPSRRRVEATRPSAPPAAICPADKVAPSPAAVTTPSPKQQQQQQQQTPSKGRKSAGGEEDMSKHPRRALSAISLNSGGNGAGGGKAPMMAAPKLGGSIDKDVSSLGVRAVAKPVHNRGSIGKDAAPSPTARTVSKSAPEPERSSVEEEKVPSLTAKAVTKPAPTSSTINGKGPSLVAQGATGRPDKQGSAPKGPCGKVSRAGGARTERLTKAKGAGARGKVEVEAPGRVLRSASRAAAAAATATAEVDGTSALQHTRSTRSTTRRPVPKTTTTERSAKSRGRFMAF